jgi:hypothetical protein
MCGVPVLVILSEMSGIKLACSNWNLLTPMFLFFISALVPDSVKKELLQRIRTFLAQHASL